jgi:hypothetical protein
MLYEDARDLYEWCVGLGRCVDPSKWVRDGDGGDAGDYESARAGVACVM